MTTRLRAFLSLRGRATRTDLLAFWFVGLFLAAVVVLASGGRPGSVAGHRMELAIALLLLWPAVSIGVRRLHDVGLSGAWLLLALPATIVILWTDWLVVRDGLPPRQRPELVNRPLLWIEQSCYLAVFVMLLWKDDAEPNHYGPNPRYDAPDQGPRNPPPAPDVVAS